MTPQRSKGGAGSRAFSSRGGRLPPQQDVDLLLDPVLVVGRVRVGRLLVHEAGEVRELVHEVEELADVVGDGGDVGVLALQVLLVDLAHALHAVVDRLVVGVGARLGLLARLDQQDGVGHLLSWCAGTRDLDLDADGDDTTGIPLNANDLRT